MKELQPNLIKIVRYLSDGEYHSGDDLGQSLAISRSAIWKVIKKLQQYGVEIHSVKSKGYLLAEPLLLLDKQQIKKQLGSLKKQTDIKVFASINSTSDYLQQHPESTRKIKICLAETQTQGRGRFNRNWYSPFGKNIYMSCRYVFQKDISELAGLSLAVGLAVLNSLRQFSQDPTLGLQWPNHIVWRHQKLAGSLLELQAEANGSCAAIIGIGMNVNLLAADVNFPWTSLRQLTGQSVDRNLLCAFLITELFKHLQQFELQGFAPFQSMWATHDALRDQTVSIHQNNETLSGIVKGVNQQGHLLLATADGKIHGCATGELIYKE